MNMMSHGQKSVERARRPGRLTDIAAGGSVAKLATVSVSGQPRSLAAAARASLVVSASTTQVRTTNQRPVPLLDREPPDDTLQVWQAHQRSTLPFGE